MLRGGEQVTELQRYLGDIYGVANTEPPIEAIFGRMLEAISETTSPFEIVDVDSTFVKGLSWYFAFCNRVQIDVQSCAIRRYPQLCPLCLSEPCVCERTFRLPARATHLAGNREETLNVKADRLLHTHKISKKKTPVFDLNWFSRSLSDVYPVNRARWKVNRFYFPAKLLRETGKLANGFRKYRNAGSSSIRPDAKKHLENDAADFFAWLIGYWSLLAYDRNDEDLQRKFVQTYESGCPYCHQVPCKCPLEKRLGNRAEFISISLLNKSPDLAKELKARFAEIKEALEPYPDLSKEFGPELEKKEASGTDARNILWRIAERIKQLDMTTGSGENIARRVSGAIEWMERTFSFFQG